MRAPILSITPILTLISPLCARNHLPIGAPPTTSVKRHRVAIFVAPHLSGPNGENSDDLLSLFSSYHDYLPSYRVAAPPHSHESTMGREPAVVL
jgi:hypothetical protein